MDSNVDNHAQTSMLAAEVDQDIIFEEKRISTIIFRGTSRDALITQLMNLVRRLSQRVEQLERKEIPAVVLREQTLAKEGTLKRVWDNPEDEVWDAL